MLESFTCIQQLMQYMVRIGGFQNKQLQGLDGVVRRLQSQELSG